MSHSADQHLHNDSLLSKNFLTLKALSAVYVVGIPLSHFSLPHAMVWEVAVFFLIAMLFTYPIAAVLQNQDVWKEVAVSLALATLGIVGLAFSMPVLIIVGIFGHGAWDLAKHYGAGCGFFRWYVDGCVTVDWLYAAALCSYLYATGGAA